MIYLFPIGQFVAPLPSKVYEPMCCSISSCWYFGVRTPPLLVTQTTPPRLVLLFICPRFSPSALLLKASLPLSTLSRSLPVWSSSLWSQPNPLKCSFHRSAHRIVRLTPHLVSCSPILLSLFWITVVSSLVWRWGACASPERKVVTASILFF